VSRPGAVPPLLQRALRPDQPRCYRHCNRLVRARSPALRAPGVLSIYACPGGAVSVVTYTEWGTRDPTPQLARFVRGHFAPVRRVHRRDFRLARREGPELGRAAERFLARARPRRPLATVYWRLYPFRTPGGAVRRVFVCYRHREPRLFVAPGDAQSPRCPRCPK
jgi:hypothetical protein